MKKSEVEFYLDSEEYWKHDFEVKYIGVSEKTGDENWVVSSLHSKARKIVHSMEEAFYLAYVAMDIYENGISNMKETPSKREKQKAAYLALYDDNLSYSENRVAVENKFKIHWAKR